MSDPVVENLIYEYFAEVKAQVDLRRENLKLFIDDYSNEIIEKITQLEVEYQSCVAKVEALVQSCTNVKQQLDNIFHRLKFYEFKFDDINVQNVFGRFGIKVK